MMIIGGLCFIDLIHETDRFAIGVEAHFKLQAPDFALERAARNDGWLSDLQTSEEILECIEKVRALRAGLGREGPFDVMASASDAHDIAGYQRLAEGGVNHILTMPWVFYHGMTDDLEQKIDGIKRFGEDVIQKMR